MFFGCRSVRCPSVNTYFARRVICVLSGRISKVMTRERNLHRVSKKTSTHIIGYKLRNSCPILIISDIKIPHII